MEYNRYDEEFRTRISQISSELERMQPNMLAEKKFQDISDRVSEMNQNRKRMVAEFNEANDAFEQCCETRKSRFMDAYQQVEAVIDTTYKDLTRSVQFTTGGQAVLALTNPDVEESACADA